MALSPIEKNLVERLGSVLSIDELDLLIDMLDHSSESLYEGVCEEFIRCYPDEAREMFGEHVGRTPEELIAKCNSPQTEEK